MRWAKGRHPVEGAFAGLTAAPSAVGGRRRLVHGARAAQAQPGDALFRMVSRAWGQEGQAPWRASPRLTAPGRERTNLFLARPRWLRRASRVGPKFAPRERGPIVVLPAVLVSPVGGGGSSTRSGLPGHSLHHGCGVAPRCLSPPKGGRLSWWPLRPVLRTGGVVCGCRRKSRLPNGPVLAMEPPRRPEP